MEIYSTPLLIRPEDDHEEHYTSFFYHFKRNGMVTHQHWTTSANEELDVTFLVVIVLQKNLAEVWLMRVLGTKLGLGLTVNVLSASHKWTWHLWYL